jgi:hypothetical protein
MQGTPRLLKNREQAPKKGEKRAGCKGLFKEGDESFCEGVEVPAHRISAASSGTQEETHQTKQ